MYVYMHGPAQVSMVLWRRHLSIG